MLEDQFPWIMVITIIVVSVCLSTAIYQLIGDMRQHLKELEQENVPDREHLDESKVSK
jgi:multisubunit Na+/H+ antiporter MnhC subunit